MWGALSLLMTLIPTFRDFRLLNVIAIAGTGFTAVYIWVSSALHGFPAGAANLAPYDVQVDHQPRACSSYPHLLHLVASEQPKGDPEENRMV